MYPKIPGFGRYGQKKETGPSGRTLLYGEMIVRISLLF